MEQTLGWEFAKPVSLNTKKETIQVGNIRSSPNISFILLLAVNIIRFCVSIIG